MCDEEIRRDDENRGWDGSARYTVVRFVVAVPIHIPVTTTFSEGKIAIEMDLSYNLVASSKRHSPPLPIPTHPIPFPTHSAPLHSNLLTLPNQFQRLAMERDRMRLPTSSLPTMRPPKPTLRLGVDL